MCPHALGSNNAQTARETSWNQSPGFIPPHRDPEKGLQLLRLRFQHVSRRWDRRTRLRRLWRFVGMHALWLTVVTALSWVMLKTLSPWEPTMTLKHLLASPSCTAARVVGLAPARKGQPGYRGHHDDYNDGIACGTPHSNEPGVYRIR